MTKTIVLIHGAWLTPTGWDLFRLHYEERGYRVIAPAWPFEYPNPKLRKLTVTQIVDHYDKIIRELPEAPIIIGHSYGGLFTQLLLDRGLGAAGVALDPVPIRGVLPRPRVFLSALPVFLTWMGWNRVLKMSYKTFSKTFAQTLPEYEKRLSFDRYIAPTPGRIYYQGVIGVGLGIHKGNPQRPPLLIAVGEKDLTITPATARAVYRKQMKSPSPTGFKVFPGRSHFIFHEAGWEEVADYALNWAQKNTMEFVPNVHDIRSATG